MQHLISLGLEANYADIMRKGTQQYLDERAVQQVLKAQEEPTLTGDLDALAAQL